MYSFCMLRLCCSFAKYLLETMGKPPRKDHSKVMQPSHKHSNWKQNDHSLKTKMGNVNEGNFIELVYRSRSPL